MKINVTRSSMPSYEEYCEEIKDLWDTRWLTNMGAKHCELCNRLKEYLNVDKIDLLTNGHMALELSLLALNLRGEVITTPFTFASTTHAIVRNGLKPVFCDINPDTYTIDVSKIEKLINDNTCAIMPVHVYGNVCDVEEIERIAKKYDLKIIYDAAHSFGVTYKNKGIATYGDVSCFSFHATKVFHTIEGGAVCYKDEEFGRRLYELKDFGIHDAESVNSIGPNAKMNEFSAAMGLCNLSHIDEEIKKRASVFERYRERFYGIDGLKMNPVQKDVRPNYAYFPIVFNEKKFGASRNEVMDKLNACGIGARKYFYPLINALNCYSQKYDVNETPIALEISKRILTLPLYADLDLKDVDLIADIVINCGDKNK